MTILEKFTTDVKEWGTNMLLKSALIVVLAGVLLFVVVNSFGQKESTVIEQAPKLEVKATPVQYSTPKVVKRPPVRRKKPSTRRSNSKLTGNQQRLYDSLEVSTRRYLSQMVAPSLLAKWEFDPDGKIQLSITEMFRLSEEALVKRYQHRIINSVKTDTIRSDTLDLRSILYK